MAAAMWMADGNMSFDDSGALTSSFGWSFSPIASPASVASTSFMFMFDDVPEPVWYTSMGNSPFHLPDSTSAAAAWMASALAFGIDLRRAVFAGTPPLVGGRAAHR